MVSLPPEMPPIRGLEPMSLTAWEGQVAAVVSLQGCNFQCPACTVPHLVPRQLVGGIPLEAVLESIWRRRRWLDAIVISGGEPMLHETLPELVTTLRQFGLAVQVHTNGSKPEMLRRLLTDPMTSNAVASVAMTIRAPLDPTYAVAVGARVRLAEIYESVEVLLRDNRRHEFRLPWLPGVVEGEQIVAILRMLAGARRVVLQQAPDGSPGVRPLLRAARAAGHLVDSCVIAGRPSEEFGALARSGRVTP